MTTPSAISPFHLHFVQQGSGFPLLLLHGNGEDGGYFAHQMDAFSRHVHVLAIDTRGHGLSPRGTTPFTLQQFVEDLKAFMDEQDLAQADLLGFSDGGNIALLFALRYPSRVRRLVLNGANLSPAGVKKSVQFPIVLAYSLVSFMARFWKGALPKKEMLGLMVNEPHIPPEELNALSIPTLVIAGTKDMIREDHTRKIHQNIPGSQLCLLPGGHFIAAQNPEAFNRQILQFLR